MKNPFEIYTSYSPKSKNRHLDWEESALDSQTSHSEIFDTDRPTGFLYWVWPFLCLCFLIIGSRLFYLQILNGASFRLISENNRIRRQIILAPRGQIIDSKGQVLAENIAGFNLTAIPLDLPRATLDDSLQRLSQTFNLDFQEAKNKILAAPKNSIQPVLLKSDLSLEQSILFETKAAEFSGFLVQKNPIRQYTNAEAFSHVIGYTGPVSVDDLKVFSNGEYDPQDFIGRSGLELQYEKYLRGSDGENLIEVDAAGKVQSVLGSNSPVPGNTLVLNIDKDLQTKLYNSLKGNTGSSRAAAVALNPRTGQVLALISLPGFNNNQFAHGIKPEEYKSLISDKTLPLFNRAIAGTYPPGSTVKPMVASAALEEGVVDEHTVIYDRGVLVIPNQYDPKVSYNFYGWKLGGLGAMDVKSAIANSSDIYFYTVAGGHPSSPIKPLGPVKLAQYYRKYNLGKATGIDLPGEKSGVVADPDWKAQYFKNDPILNKWYLGDTYHIGIGQGDMLATPLQVAEWTAIIANNGVGMKPEVVNIIKDQSGQIVYANQSQVLVKQFISDENLKIVQAGMRQTVTAGSGRQLNSLPITSAGKTGTSQFDGADPSRTHAWFTAYAPFEDPQIVITVLVEAGGEGHIAAEPVVKDALMWWAENRYKK